MKRNYILLVFTLICSLNLFSQNINRSPDQYIVDRKVDINGKETVSIIVPGMPPEHHREPVAIPARSAVLLNYVPAFDWSFGCSATAAAMGAGYYDNNGYPNMYAGPTNYGFMPMDNSSWGYADINGENRALCPLSATRNGLDGRTSRGHVDDYWIVSGNTGPDPFITNGWAEHTLGECTGDFMRTNQSSFGSSDGSTTFVFYVDGSPFSGSDGDGAYGLKQFYLSRGYNVLAYYSQYIYGWDGNTIGFTFEQYKQEINNGRPVLIQLSGHTVLGYGYDDTGNTVYVHDTWDYSSHTMTWGGTYADLQHYGVSVVQPAPSTAGLVANFSADPKRQLINTTVNLTDMTWGNPTAWNWSISPATYTYTGGTSAASQHPQVQFTAGGLYSVTLTVNNANGADSESKTNYIEAVDCAAFPFPVNEDFSEVVLPFCWQIIDHQGNGQVWQFATSLPGWIISTATANNGFAYLNSDAYGDGNSQNADLVTPSIDLSSYSNVNLYFQHYFKSWSGSSGTLSYSINGGSTWNVIQTWTEETGNPAVFNQVITQVAGQSNVKFKWNYTGSYGYYWVVDDVSITGTLSGVWTGTASTAWGTAANWSDAAVPASTTNVTIPGSAPNWPVYPGTLTLGTQCKNITMNGAAQMTINGALSIPSGRTFNITGTGLLKIKGNMAKNGTFNAGTGTVEFFGNANASLSGTATTFYQVIISKTSPYYFDFNVNAIINKNLNVLSGASYKVKTGKTININGF